MAVIVNTAQGIGQPIRGTCLTSLGSTGIVAAWYADAKQQSNFLVVPEFGTHLELTLVAKSTATSPPAVNGIKIWGLVPAEGANPSRNWPVDYHADFGMGPNNAEIWVLLDHNLSLAAPTHVFAAGDAKVGVSSLVALRGASEIKVSCTLPTDGSVLVLARFVD
jgi:hypothetical protein